MSQMVSCSRLLIWRPLIGQKDMVSDWRLKRYPGLKYENWVIVNDCILVT